MHRWEIHYTRDADGSWGVLDITKKLTFAKGEEPWEPCLSWREPHEYAFVSAPDELAAMTAFARLMRDGEASEQTAQRLRAAAIYAERGRTNARPPLG